MVASHYTHKVSWIKQLLSHVDWEARESIARLLGIVSSALPMPASSVVISELTSSISTHKSRFEYFFFNFLSHFNNIPSTRILFFYCQV